jgi:MoaA/NifB/PqqE/SkfB family radical SAM enzyme
MKLNLKEIIWEITGKCNNGCTYCGSKDLWKQDVNENLIMKIADSIAEYPPKEIDISGGDPLLVSFDTHQYITNKLNKTTKCKILINPKSLLPNTTCASEQLKILSLYSHVGVSINTQEELEMWKVFISKATHQLKYTVITNFNLTNFFLFDEFAKVIGKDILWQVQFTMYHAKDKNNQLAMYNHPQAVEQLNNNIAKYPDLKLIFADNCNHGECAAGIHTIGILADGEVVPCLSMRSWYGDITKCTEGNVLKTKLKEIWFNGFKANRFEEFKSCKDICNGLVLKKPEKPLIPPGPTKRQDPFTMDPFTGSPYTPPMSVQVYGVSTPDTLIQRYPQYPFDAVTAYAVSTGENIFGKIYEQSQLNTQFKTAIQDALVQKLNKETKDK